MPIISIADLARYEDARLADEVIGDVTERETTTHRAEASVGRQKFTFEPLAAGR